MGYQIATEGFFDMFKKKKPQLDTSIMDDRKHSDIDKWQVCADRAQTHFPCLSISTGQSDDAPTSSRIWGSVYTMPQHVHQLSKMILAAQINIKDLKYNPHLPKRGLVQFYVDNTSFDEGAMVFIAEKDFNQLTKTETRSGGRAMIFSKLDKPSKKLNMDEVVDYFHGNNHFDNVFGPPVSYQSDIADVDELDIKFPEILTIGLDHMSVNYAMRKGAIKGTTTQIIPDKDISVVTKYD